MLIDEPNRFGFMPEDERSRFSALIREMFEASGYTTKKDYAAVIGVTDDTLTNWLNGGFTDKIDNWIKVCRVRGWTLDQLREHVYGASEAGDSLGERFDPMALKNEKVPISKVLQTLQICADRLNLHILGSKEKLIM